MGHRHTARALSHGVFLNPVHYIVQGYRDSFLYAVPVTDRIAETLLFWAIAGALLVLGVFVFRRLRPQFADLV